MILSILVIEDDSDLRKYIRDLLIDNGYAATAVETGVEALTAMEKSQPNLVVLDLGLPDMKGESLCSTIRDKYPETKIIILTARNTTQNVVEGLNLGADDYISKPFDGAELLARIAARLRRDKEHTPVLTIDDLTVNTDSMEVTRGSKAVALTAQEFRLLEYLLINKEKVLSRDMILNRLWRASPDVETRVVDVYIGYLRKKIDKGFKKKLLHSIRGFGYVIKE